MHYKETSKQLTAECRCSEVQAVWKYWTKNYREVNSHSATTFFSTGKPLAFTHVRLHS